MITNEPYIEWLKQHNIGDIVYVITKKYTECTADGICYDDILCAGCESECDSKLELKIKEVLVDGFEINSIGLKIHLHNGWNVYLPDDRVFFTKAEAEKKLRGGKL